MACRTRFLLLIFLTVLTVAVYAYNDDRPIYKWSPLWFRSYLRRGALQKRWGPGEWVARNCQPEWTPCRVDGRRCCSGACFEGTCIGNGEYYDGDYDR